MRTIQRLSLLLLLTAWGSSSVWAQQSASVTGQVVDDGDGTGLPGASIILTRPGSTSIIKGVAADFDGRYLLTGIDPGQYEIVVSFVGFSESRQEVDLSAGEQATVNITLMSGGIGMDDVIVTASRRQEKALDAPASVSVLSTEEIENQVSVSSVDVLRTTTGVDIAQTGIDRREVVLRGFNEPFSTSAFVLTDYRRGNVPSLGVNAFNLMPISNIDLDRIEVVRGPGSALYGPGVDSGVIHFFTKSPFTYPGTTVAVTGGERSFLGVQARHAGVIGERLGYKITGLYSQAEDWRLDPENDRLDAIQDSLYHRTREREYDVNKMNVNGLLEYRFNPITSLTANVGYSTAQSPFQSVIGTLQAIDFGYTYGQLRLTAGDFFAQAYVNRNNSGDSYVYAGPSVAQSLSGEDVIDKSILFNTQAQYGLTLMEGRERLTFGADFERTSPETDGTITGRNEDDDTIIEYGAYVQSETELTDQFDLVLAGRLDYDNIYENLQVSPRAALVFAPTPTSSFRATYNRAFSSPGTNSLFLDISAREQVLAPGTGLPYAIIIQARGTANGFTFNNYRDTNTGLFSLPFPSLFGQPVDLSEIPLAPIYAVAAGGGVVDSLVSPTFSLPGLTGPQRGLLAQLVGYTALQGSLGAANTDAVQLSVRDDTEPTGYRSVSGPVDLEPLEQTVTQSFEVGYKGIVSNRLVLAVDAYYSQKKNFVGPLFFGSPFALLQGGQLTQDVGATLGGLFTTSSDATIQGLLQQLNDSGLSDAEVAGIIATLVGGGLNNKPAAVVQPDQPVLPVGAENAVGGFLAYQSFGNVQFYGMDISSEFLATDQLRFFGNLSWVSDNFFDNEELDETNTDLSLALNAPELKWRAGVNYALRQGLSVNLAGRYTEGFPMDGIYSGDVESYFLMDLGAGYDFERFVPGLRFDVTVYNLLDNMHREFIGAPKMGRLALGRLTYTTQ